MLSAWCDPFGCSCICTLNGDDDGPSFWVGFWEQNWVQFLDLYVASLAETLQSRARIPELCVYKEKCLNEIKKEKKLSTHTPYGISKVKFSSKHEETAILDSGFELHYWDSVCWIIEFRSFDVARSMWSYDNETFNICFWVGIMLCHNLS